MQGVINDTIFGVAIAASDMWGWTTGFVVALMTLQSTWGVIQTSSCMMENWENLIAMQPKRFIIFINNALCLHSFKFASTDSLSQFIYCYFLFAYGSDVIDCFQHLSIHCVNVKYVTITNIKRFDDLLRWCLVK